MAEMSIRRDSNASLAVRRESLSSRRESETSRRESAASTTVSSDGTGNEGRRKSSVFAGQGEWKPTSPASIPNSTMPSRRMSENSQTSASRRPSDEDGAEINFGNGDYASVGSRRSTPSPTGLRKSTSVNSLGEENNIQTFEPAAMPVRRLSNVQPNSLVKRQSGSALDNALPLSEGGDQLSKPPGHSDLPPLPPSPTEKSKRFATVPKVASKLRSMMKRTSSDRTSQGDDAAKSEGDEFVASPPQLTTTNLDQARSDYFNEHEQSDVFAMSPGRARIYTVEQSRRGSFLPINRVRNQDGAGPRRTSIRLSEADVGLLLGKVSRISSDTLRQAATEGNSSLCEALVRGSVPIDETDVQGKTALMFAAENGRGDATEHLLVLGANVESKDENGMTPLYFAVVGTKVSCVKALMAWGADPNIIVSGDTIFTTAFLRIETTLSILDEKERKASYVQTSEVCRILVKECKASPNVRREKLRKPILFLLDEWVRAKGAQEELVVPPIESLQEGEKTLINFLKSHRQRVNLIATIKIWFVVTFIGFDLATREMTMTPARLLTYVVLYVGAYYL